MISVSSLSVTCLRSVRLHRRTDAPAAQCQKQQPSRKRTTRRDLHPAVDRTKPDVPVVFHNSPVTDRCRGSGGVESHGAELNRRGFKGRGCSHTFLQSSQFLSSTHTFHLKSKRMDAAYKKVNGSYSAEVETENQGPRVNLT